MKIALCTEILYPLYGVERRVYEMARRLGKFIEIDVYTSSSQIELPDIKIMQMSNRTITKPPKRNYAFCTQYMINLFRELLKNDYDIIDANGHLTLIPCSSAGFLKRSPVVATIHDLYLGEWKQMYRGRGSFFGLPFELLSAKMQFTKIITLNSSLKNRMINTLRINPEKIEIIPSGIDFNYIKKIKAGSRLENRILYVGRLVPQKNISLLIRAFSKISKDAELIIIGGGGEESRLKEMSKNLNLGSRIKFMGSIKNYDSVIREMKKATMLVLPSNRENFGIVPLEAMACGTPIISTATEGPMDYIKNGENGFLTPIGDESQLRESIEILLSDSKLRKVIGNNGVKTAKEYDWSKIIEKLFIVYENVMRK